MTVEEYLKLMAEENIDRGQLATGIEHTKPYGVLELRGKPVLPPGTVEPPKPPEPPEEDLSHLNSLQWKTHQKNGTRGGRKPKQCE